MALVVHHKENASDPSPTCHLILTGGYSSASDANDVTCEECLDALAS